MNKHFHPLVSLVLLAPLASVACGGAIREGTAYRDDTAKLITAQANPKIHDCFDSMVKSTPGPTSLAGKTTVHFIVAKETGLITSPTVVPDGTTAQGPVAQCVVTALDGMKLDPPDNVDGDATFTWEFQVQ
jgi:hypothetical protein